MSRRSAAYRFDERYESYVNYEEKQRQAEIIQFEKISHQQFLKAKKQHRLFCIKFAVALFMVFATILVNIVSIGTAKKYQVEIHALQNNLKHMKEQNLALQSEIIESVDIAYVEEYAKANLNMSSPQPHQIIHITMPKDSYTINHVKAEKQNSDFSLSAIINFFE